MFEAKISQKFHFNDPLGSLLSYSHRTARCAIHLILPHVTKMAYVHSISFARIPAPLAPLPPI